MTNQVSAEQLNKMDEESRKYYLLDLKQATAIAVQYAHMLGDRFTTTENLSYSELSSLLASSVSFIEANLPNKVGFTYQAAADAVVRMYRAGKLYT